MDPMDIPIATPLEKTLVVCVCALFSIIVIWWTAPKFAAFAKTAFGRAAALPRPNAVTIALGFVIYAVIFVTVIFASVVAIRIVTLPPTVVSSAGVAGGTFACSSGGISLSCSVASTIQNTRTTIAWPEIERVECEAGEDRTVRAIDVYSTTRRRIEIGNAAVHDLRAVLDVILKYAPPAAATPCHG